MVDDSVQLSSTSSFLVGRVVSNKMNKTVVVLVERKKPHKKYRKFVVKSTRYPAHVSNEKDYPEGSLVEIKEVRPISRTKNWLVTRIIT